MPTYKFNPENPQSHFWDPEAKPGPNYNPETEWYPGCVADRQGPPPNVFPEVSVEERERRGNEWAEKRGGWEVQNRNAREVVRQQNESKKKGG